VQKKKKRETQETASQGSKHSKMGLTAAKQSTIIPDLSTTGIRENSKKTQSALQLLKLLDSASSTS
jgi:hypothetical protein